MQFHFDTRETRPRASRRAELVQERPSVLPRVDVFENEDELVLFFDVPGVAKDDLRIDIDKDRLTVEARRGEPKEPTGSALDVEYRAVDYRRTFLVPRGVDRENVEATLKNGVLCLKLPRSSSVKPRTVQVKSG